MWCSSMAVRTWGATGCWWQPVGARASRRSAWRRSVSRPTPTGSRLTSTCAPASALWAIGDVNGIWPLTHVGEYEGDVVAANISGDARPANYEAVPRVTYTDPQAAAVGAVEAEYSATAPVSEVPRTATYTHAYAESNGFLTLLSDGERLTGAYALGPEAGEWMQQATLAIRAHVPLEVLSDTIQPFPSFSGIYDAAVVNLIAAGFVDTPLSASLLGDRLDNGGTETARRGERRSHDWETSRPTQAGGPGARQRRHPARL